MARAFTVPEVLLIADALGVAFDRPAFSASRTSRWEPCDPPEPRWATGTLNLPDRGWIGTHFPVGRAGVADACERHTPPATSEGPAATALDLPAAATETAAAARTPGAPGPRQVFENNGKKIVASWEPTATPSVGAHTPLQIFEGEHGRVARTCQDELLAVCSTDQELLIVTEVELTVFPPFRRADVRLILGGRNLARLDVVRVDELARLTCDEFLVGVPGNRLALTAENTWDPGWEPPRGYEPEHEEEERPQLVSVSATVHYLVYPAELLRRDLVALAAHTVSAPLAPMPLATAPLDVAAALLSAPDTKAVRGAHTNANVSGEELALELEGHLVRLTEQPEPTATPMADSKPQAAEQAGRPLALNQDAPVATLLAIDADYPLRGGKTERRKAVAIKKRGGEECVTILFASTTGETPLWTSNKSREAIHVFELVLNGASVKGRVSMARSTDLLEAALRKAGFNEAAVSYDSSGTARVVNVALRPDPALEALLRGGLDARRADEGCPETVLALGLLPRTASHSSQKCVIG